MARQRGFPSRVPIRSQRRKVAWGDGPSQTRASQTAIAKLGWTFGAGLTLDVGGTVVRIRGQALLQLLEATPSGSGFTGAVGIGIASEDAFGVGITALPGPFSDADWGGWLWHSFFHLYATAAQASGADVARNANVDLRMEIDTKAMRKMGPNEVIFGMWETVAEAGTSTIQYVADTRMLVKLP